MDVVIVNWNAGIQLRQCVDSLLVNDNNEIKRIIVIDNGSTDGSADSIEDLPRVMLVRNNDNLGFAAACNVGALVGDSPYILFLNPDTRVEANSLSVPLGFMKCPENSGVGVCGIQLVDERGVVSRTCARFPTLRRLTISALGLDKLPGLRSSGVRMNNREHESTRCVDQVMGAFFLIRRNLFLSCHGFDERFFVYFEEVDLSLRTKMSGHESWYLTEAQAFHAGNGTSQQVKARRLFYSLRSRLLYGFKHFPHWQAWCLVGVTGLIEPFTRSAWCLLRGDVIGVLHTWSAYRMLWAGMRRIVVGEGRF